MLASIALKGFFSGAGLIIAIGAQNAFILKLGLIRRHLLPAVLFCAISDAVLIAAGVAGLGALVERYKSLLHVVTIGGALFVFVYGVLAMMRAFKAEAMVARGEDMSLSMVLMTLATFTWINPHVYLDTVLLLGSLSAAYEGDAKMAFAIGAVTASFVWFFLLGYGARILAPAFARPITWRILDGVIALIMWAIAYTLIKPYLAEMIGG